MSSRNVIIDYNLPQGPKGQTLHIGAVLREEKKPVLTVDSEKTLNNRQYCQH